MAGSDIDVLAAASQRALPQPLAILLDHANVALNNADFVIRTGRWVDVGLWFRRHRVWLIGERGTLLLTAAGTTPLIERIACGDLRESTYNHVTSAVLFGPEKGSLGYVNLPADVGYALLNYIGVPPDANQVDYDLRPSAGHAA